MEQPDLFGKFTAGDQPVVVPGLPLPLRIFLLETKPLACIDQAHDPRRQGRGEEHQSGQPAEGKKQPDNADHRDAALDRLDQSVDNPGGTIGSLTLCSM